MDIDSIRTHVEATVVKERASLQADQTVARSADQTIPDSDIWRAVNANEDGDAWLFTQLHRGRLLFDHAAGTWYEWTGQFWAEDHVVENLTAVEAVVDVYAQEAQRAAWLRHKASRNEDREAESGAKKREGAFLARVKELQRLQRKRNVLTLASVGRRGLGITGEEWDQRPWLLACPNGTVDLQTGKLRPGRQEDFIKTACPTPWRDLNIKAPAWESFLDEVFEGDRELIGYVQRLFGYAITGLTTEHVFPILWGAGRNGKGTILQTLALVLGPLAGPVKVEMLLDQSRTRSSAAPDSDIMSLRAKRLVWASAIDEGRRLNAGRAKWLVGGDTLCGRAPFGKREVTFKPSHTLLLLTNHRPKADPSDYALWQRIHLIPFTLSFVDEPSKANERRRDPQIAERLKAEASGILSWLVRGCLTWQIEGLKPPDKVKAATEEYRMDEDLIGHFLGERCLVSAAASIRAGELYKAYQLWCDEMGQRPISGTRFGKDMRERFEATQDYRGVFYFGIGLLET